MKKLFLSAILCMGALASLCAQQQYDVRLHLDRGQTYKYQITANTPYVMTMMGQRVEVKQSQTADYTLTVTDVKEGNYRLSINIDRLQMVAGSMGQEMSIDTDNADADNPLYGEVSKLIDVPVQIWVDPYFRIQGAPEAAPGTDAAVIDAILSAATLPAIYSETPMAQGQSRELTTPPFGSDEFTKYAGTLTLAAVSETDCSLRANGTTTATEQGLVMEGNGIDNIVLDRKTGMIKSTFSTMSLKGSGNVQGMMVEATTNAITTIRRL